MSSLSTARLLPGVDAREEVAGIIVVAHVSMNDRQWHPLPSATACAAAARFVISHVGLKRRAQRLHQLRVLGGEGRGGGDEAGVGLGGWIRRRTHDQGNMSVVA